MQPCINQSLGRHFTGLMCLCGCTSTRQDSDSLTRQRLSEIRFTYSCCLVDSGGLAMISPPERSRRTALEVAQLCSSWSTWRVSRLHESMEGLRPFHGVTCLNHVPIGKMTTSTTVVSDRACKPPMCPRAQKASTLDETCDRWM
eukprot:5660001-Amphidinium_carterae.1